MFWFLVPDLAVYGVLLMDWSVYNDSLVRRGEILRDFSVLKSWDREGLRLRNRSVKPNKQQDVIGHYMTEKL